MNKDGLEKNYVKGKRWKIAGLRMIYNYCWNEKVYPKGENWKSVLVGQSTN